MVCGHSTAGVPWAGKVALCTTEIGPMSILFAQWRKAERLKFDADLRGLKRSGRGQYWRRLRRGSRANVALLGFAACAGMAIGFALDLLDHDRREPDPAQTAPVIILRPASVTTTATVTVIYGDTLKLGN